MKCKSCGKKESYFRILNFKFGQQEVKCTECGAQFLSSAGMLILKVYLVVFGGLYLILSKFMFEEIIQELIYLFSFVFGFILVCACILISNKNNKT